MIGIIIDGYLKWKLNIQGEQFGSIADWFSAIGTIGGVLFSLWASLLRKPKIKVYKSYPKVVFRNGRNVPEKIRFTAYNESDKNVSLAFYGVRKRDETLFSRPDYYHRSIEYKPEDDAVDYSWKNCQPGEHIDYTYPIDDFALSLDLYDYVGVVEFCFAEPNGRRIIRRFKWGNFNLKFKK